MISTTVLSETNPAENCPRQVCSSTFDKQMFNYMCPPPMFTFDPLISLSGSPKETAAQHYVQRQRSIFDPLVPPSSSPKESASHHKIISMNPHEPPNRPTKSSANLSKPHNVHVRLWEPIPSLMQVPFGATTLRAICSISPIDHTTGTHSNLGKCSIAMRLCAIQGIRRYLIENIDSMTGIRSQTLLLPPHCGERARSILKILMLRILHIRHWTPEIKKSFIVWKSRKNWKREKQQS